MNLHRTVRACLIGGLWLMFEAPSESQLRAVPAEFPETAAVSGLVEAMVGIDERWEHLAAVRVAGYQVPPGHPDVDPVNEAVILWEHFREARRLPEVPRHGEDMARQFSEAEAEGKEVERLLRLFREAANPGIKMQLDQVFDALDRSCSACHKAYRNPDRIHSKL